MVEMNDHERFWMRKARAVCHRVNWGWLFEKATPVLIIVGFLVTTAILILRTQIAEQSVAQFIGPILIGSGLVLLAGVVGSWLLARKHFLGIEQGLVRLEAEFQLNNSLTAAFRGIADWPEPGLARETYGLSWNLPRLAVPLLFVVMLVCGAVFVPIPDLGASTGDLRPNEPASWGQMEDWLDELEEENLIDEEVLEANRDKISALREQPEEEWFSHSSMEASDSLRESLGRDLQEAARDLQTLERDLAALEQYSGEMSGAARDMLMKEYDEALKNLGLNSTSLNQSLLDQMKGVDLQKLAQGQMNQLSREQLKQLQEQMKSGCD